MATQGKRPLITRPRGAPRGVSCDLGDFVGDPAVDQVPRSHADDVVQPCVLFRAGLEEGVGPEVVAGRVDVAAGQAFTEAVTRPAGAQPPGIARLRVLADRWIAYAEQPLFPGGCFWAANLPVFDSQPGPVRDALTRQQRAWRGLIAAELRHAAGTGQIAAVDADRAAFQIDAVLTATNTALRLGDDSAVSMTRRIINGFLAPPD